MGSMAAALSRQCENVVPLVITMLEELGHRGKDKISIATPDSRVDAKGHQELLRMKTWSETAVGIGLSKHHPSCPVIVQKKGYSLALEGHLFPPSKTSDIEEIANQLEPEPSKKAAAIIKRFDGSYSFAIVLPNIIVAGRDLSGTSPLFIGQNEAACAIASERKALWRIGITQAESFPPGNIATLAHDGLKLRRVATTNQSVPTKISAEKAAKRLYKLLLDSTAERVTDIEKVGVAFSGGLDSSVIAVLAKKCNRNVELLTVGLKGQAELRHAEIAAEALGLPIHVRAFTVADVEEALKKVLWLMEEPDVMKAGVAVPFFWAGQIASENRCQILLAGQGADELFGGYHKYLGEYSQSGAEAVEKAMFKDVANSYETNFQRDSPVCAFHKVELRLPFTDRKVTEFALGLPVSMKVTSAQDNTRKHALRLIARNTGIPAFISDKPKKAVQYTTGVDKAIKILARKKGLTHKEYVKQLFHEAYPSLKELKE